MSRARSQRGNNNNEEDEDVRTEMPQPSLKHFVRNVADATSPGLTWFFAAFFLLVAYFHEAYPKVVFLAIVPWLLIQFASSILDEDFREGALRFALGTFSAVLQYCGTGFVWALAKLMFDRRLDRLPDRVTEALAVCDTADFGYTCYADIFQSLAYPEMLEWTLFWPFSAAFTLTRDPLRLAYEIAMQNSERAGVWILQAAAPTNRAGGASALGWVMLGIAAYFLVGFLWTHAKLYWDVRYQNLPKRLDDIAVECYQSNDGSGFWPFVLAIKWLIMWWMIVWPFTFLSTILRNPIKEIAERLYEFSQRKYAWIAHKAMERRMHKDE